MSFYNRDSAGRDPSDPGRGRARRVRRCRASHPMQWGPDGELIYLLQSHEGGVRRSAVATLQGLLTGMPPEVDLAAEKVLAEILVAGSRDGMLTAAHDAADGGSGWRWRRWRCAQAPARGPGVPDGIDVHVPVLESAACAWSWCRGPRNCGSPRCAGPGVSRVSGSVWWTRARPCFAGRGSLHGEHRGNGAAQRRCSAQPFRVRPIEPVVLQGRWVRLEPLAADHSEPLRAIDDPALFTYLPDVPDDFDGWLPTALASRDPLFYAAVVDGRTLGRASFPAWTPQRRRRSATSCGAITRCGGRRPPRKLSSPDDRPPRPRCAAGGVKCDNLNEASKPRRCGSVSRSKAFSGQHKLVKGRNRDTAWFSLLDHEWPARRAALSDWLDPGTSDVDGHQRRRLNARLPLDLVDQVLQRRTRLCRCSPRRSCWPNLSGSGPCPATWLMRSLACRPAVHPALVRVPCHPERHPPRPSPDLLILSVLTAMMASFSLPQG